MCIRDSVYLDDLIYNKRSTPRAGLPRNLIEELTILKTINLENTGSADAPPPLDKAKVAAVKKKKASPEKRKEEKLEEVSKAKKLEKETSLEFTLPDKK